MIKRWNFAPKFWSNLFAMILEEEDEEEEDEKEDIEELTKAKIQAMT